jgi:hypothetical protein
VFLPDEIRKNELLARSELMKFLGYDSSNYWFMRHQAGNIIPVSPHAIFNETFFPKCPNSKPSENVQEHLEKESRSPSSTEGDDIEGQNNLDLFSPSHPLNPTPGPPPTALQPPGVQPPHNLPLPNVPGPSSLTPGLSRPVPTWDKGKRHADSPLDESERPLH